MLNTVKIIEIFKNFLNKPTKNYADEFNFDIYTCLGLIEGDSSHLRFFESFSSVEEINDWINLVKSKIILHEDEDEPEEIINEYIYLRENFLLKT